MTKFAETLSSLSYVMPIVAEVVNELFIEPLSSSIGNVVKADSISYVTSELFSNDVELFADIEDLYAEMLG
jgi:hypothetical protein